MTWINKLNAMAAGIAFVAITACGIALFAPCSEIAGTIERFQTLFTGVVAGLAALVTAGFVYRAAKLPIEAASKKEAEHSSAMRAAGAAALINATTVIYMSVISEAGKDPKNRLGRLVVPDALPDLDVISTQENGIVKDFSEFVTLASVLDTHTVLGTWQFDPKKSHPHEKKLADKLNVLANTLKEKLEIVAKGITT